MNRTDIERLLIEAGLDAKILSLPTIIYPRNSSWVASAPATLRQAQGERLFASLTVWVNIRNSVRPEPVEGWAEFPPANFGIQVYRLRDTIMETEERQRTNRAIEEDSERQER